MADQPRTGNGWSEYQRLVLSELEDHKERLEGIARQLSDITIQLAILKTKAAMWGSLAGAVLGFLGSLLMKAITG